MLYFILLKSDKVANRITNQGEHLINELELNVNENCNASMQYKNTMESNIKEENRCR